MLDGIEAAVNAGLEPVKVNVVLMRGVNEDEVVDFATFGRERGVVVRFIEFMPLDADGVVSRPGGAAGRSGDGHRRVYPLEPVARGHEPAERFRYQDGLGEIGVIGSVSQPFCTSCDRVRLTADGQLRNCLFALQEHDLRAVLRSGGTDDDLASVVEAAVAAKARATPSARCTIRPSRSMSQIGG